MNNNYPGWDLTVLTLHHRQRVLLLNRSVLNVKGCSSVTPYLANLRRTLSSWGNQDGLETSICDCFCHKSFAFGFSVRNRQKGGTLRTRGQGHCQPWDRQFQFNRSGFENCFLGRILFLILWTLHQLCSGIQRICIECCRLVNICRFLHP